jgi:4-oxalocrotonate tautomerase
MKDCIMPLVSIKALAGVFSSSQKAELIKRVTDAVVAVEGERMRPLTWVIVEEVVEGEWGIGGQGVTVSGVLAVQAGDVKLKDVLGLD